MENNTNVEAMIRAGRLMANYLFNTCQHRKNDQEIANMDAVKAWDTAVREWSCGTLPQPLSTEYRALMEKNAALNAMVAELTKRLNTPELEDFSRGVVSEAQHQRLRWGSAHDAGKLPEDWFWLVGYLAGKALAAHIAGNIEKALHHTISTAAALANWHAGISGTNNSMRPGITTPEEHAGGAD